MPRPPAILVADDDSHVTDLIESVLLSSGYAPLRAEDGEDAVRIAARELPSLVLLDIMMPRLDGYGVLDALRADPRTRAIPVIILSAKDVVADVEKCYQKGATDFLRKPFTAERLLGKIRKHLGASAPP